MSEPNTLPSPTAIRRFIRDTARGIQNDFTTAQETLGDFLNIDPQEQPQEAGESIQIAIRKAEKSKERLTSLVKFVDELKVAEVNKSQETKQQVADAFNRLKATLESNASTSGMLN